ncbi:MAG: glycosyltransferase [Oscillospiraceae bacterium]|nr:glycosyltransferase [Oscillospiraceae bacterium]
MPSEAQNQPLVSIIVPVYNAADHIARCIESIRKQTYTNLEILLLNDGSKDVSSQVCQSYAGVDKRITVIDKENSGVSATRNLGMRHAAGKYFQFVDADDFIQPYATEMLVEKAESCSADMVIAHYNRVEPPLRLPEAVRDTVVERALDPILDPSHRVQSFGFLMEGPLDKYEFACGLMQEPASFYYGVMWNKLYRADIVREHEDVVCSEDLDYSEDLYFNLNFIRYAEQFYALSTPIYNYVQNPNSAVHHLNPLDVLTTRFELSKYYKDLYKHLGLYEQNKLRLNKYFFGIAES